MEEFQAGQNIMTAAGKPLEIMNKLGEGGQGIVYKVKYEGREMALK